MTINRLRSTTAGAALAASLMLSGCATTTTAEAPTAPMNHQSTVPAPIEAPLIARQDLFGNPTRAAGRLSPDGKFVSWMAPVDGVMNIFVAPASDPTSAKPITSEKGRPPAGYFWAPDSKTILYAMDSGGDENFRLYAVDVATAERKALTEGKPKVRTEIRGVSRLRPNVVLIGLNDRDPQLFDLYEVDYRTGKKTLVERNDGYASFSIDPMLKPRFAIKQAPGGATTVFERDGKSGWKESFTISAEDSLTTSLVGFNRDATAAYMVDSRDRNTAALVRWSLDTGERQVLGTNDKADISGLLLDPQSYEPLAYASNHLKNEWTPLDKGFAADLAFLKSQLPGELSFTGLTDDSTKMMVVASSAKAPAVYYLYDRKSRELTKLFEARPELSDAPLQPMHPIVIPSSDGLELVSYLTLPPGSDPDGNGVPDKAVPMVLLVHGGPWARDGYGYNGTHQWLANRGYAVLSVNYRGSTGFGKDFLNAAVREWSGKMHQDLIDAVDWSIARGITSRDQVAIMGGSYGGYATLVGLTFTPDRFACGVSIVGPSNLVTLMRSFPAYWRPILEGTFIRHIGDPENAEDAARMTAQSPISRVEKINKPLLIGQGANDPRVVKAESDQIVDAMRARGLPVTYVLYPDEGHGFARPENSLSFNAVAEGFLSQCLGGRQEPIGDDFKGSSIQLLEGAEHVPGLRAALPAEGG